MYRIVTVPCKLRYMERGAFFFSCCIALSQMLLEVMHVGDSVCYADSDTLAVVDPKPLLCLAQNSDHGVVIFSNHHRESLYTDRDTFVRMGLDVKAVAETQ